MSRGALSQLAVTVGLDNPEDCTPEEILEALYFTREKKQKVEDQIAALQEKEAAAWKQLISYKTELQQGRLGLSARLVQRMSMVQPRAEPRSSVAMGLLGHIDEAPRAGGPGDANADRGSENGSVSEASSEVRPCRLRPPRHPPPPHLRPYS